MVESGNVLADGDEIEIGGFIFFFDCAEVGVEVFDSEFDQIAILDDAF